MVSENTKNEESKVKKEVKKSEKKDSKSKRMIGVSFTGKELLNGEVFDTTNENVAKDAEIFDEKRTYGPLTIISGEKEMLPVVEKEVEKMKVGEEKVVHLDAKNGFGERQADLVRVIPIKVFHEQKITPVPGLVIGVGQMPGKVQSVSGGRVRVDFNHPLAGRELEYTLKVEKEFKTKKEIAEQFFDKYYSQIPNTKKEIKENNLYITIPSEVNKNLEKVNDSVKKLGNGFGIKVSFKESKETVPKEKSEEKNEEKEVAKEDSKEKEVVQEE